MYFKTSVQCILPFISSSRLFSKNFSVVSQQIQFRMPNLTVDVCKLEYNNSFTMHLTFKTIVKDSSSSATLTQWLKSEGDCIKSGERLCEVETTDFVAQLQAESDGILAKIGKVKRICCSVACNAYDAMLTMKIVVEPGTTDIEIGKVLAILVKNEEEWNAFRVISKN